MLTPDAIKQFLVVKHDFVSFDLYGDFQDVLRMPLLYFCFLFVIYRNCLCDVLAYCAGFEQGIRRFEHCCHAVLSAGFDY